MLREYGKTYNLQTFSSKLKRTVPFTASRRFMKRFLEDNDAKTFCSRQLEENRLISRSFMEEDVVRLAQAMVKLKKLNGGKLDGSMIGNLDETPLFQKKGDRRRAVSFGVSEKSHKRPIEFYNETMRKSLTCIFTAFANGAVLDPYYLFHGGQTKTGTHPLLNLKASFEHNQSNFKWGYDITDKGSLTSTSWRKFFSEFLVPSIDSLRAANGHTKDTWYLITLDGAGSIHCSDPEVSQHYLEL